MFGWLLDLFRDRDIERVNRQFAAMERLNEQFGSTCPICNGTDVFLCVDCGHPIKSHSHENDWLCDCVDPRADGMDSSIRAGSMRFVGVTRQSDGARMRADGTPTDSVEIAAKEAENRSHL